MKKVHVFLIAMTVALASCKDGKLPNASITGATFGDYVPYVMMIVGALFLAFTAFDELTNKQAYANKTKNPAQKRFVFGAGGAILLIMGVLIAFA